MRASVCQGRVQDARPCANARPPAQQIRRGQRKLGQVPLGGRPASEDTICFVDDGKQARMLRYVLRRAQKQEGTFAQCVVKQWNDAILQSCVQIDQQVAAGDQI